MENIILHVYYKGADDNAAKFAEEMMNGGLQKEVKAEQGCIQYDYFKPADGSSGVLLLECWKDAEALAAHSVSPAMEKIRALKTKYALETKIERYE